MNQIELCNMNYKLYGHYLKNLFKSFCQQSQFIVKILFCIILLMFLLSNCQKVVYTKIENEKESGSSMSIKKFKRYSYNLEGKLQWELISDESYIFSESNRTIFYKITFNQFEKGKKQSELKADKADLNNQEKKLYLFGNIVAITSDKERKKLIADELVYDMETEELSTDKKVSIITQGNKINGIGFSADKNLTKFKILKPLGVSTTFEAF